MARKSELKNKYNRVLSGNLAFDYDYEERQELRRALRETAVEHPVRKAEPVRRKETQEAPARRVRVRERQKVSPLMAMGFAALAMVVVVVLMSYAQLTTLSAEVVSMQRDLAALEDEHVMLLTQHEQTFDLSAVKEAAQAAGMYKPSASQVYYIDLSAPDSVEIYAQDNVSVLSRIFTSFGQSVYSVVEYFC